MRPAHWSGTVRPRDQPGHGQTPQVTWTRGARGAGSGRGRGYERKSRRAVDAPGAPRGCRARSPAARMSEGAGRDVQDDLEPWKVPVAPRGRRTRPPPRLDAFTPDRHVARDHRCVSVVHAATRSSGLCADRPRRPVTKIASTIAPDFRELRWKLLRCRARQADRVSCARRPFSSASLPGGEHVDSEPL